jgi:uncharacterized protein (DUF2336 family)
VSKREFIVNQPFRALETLSSLHRKDDIVVAAVSAFAARTRPARVEADQLEDLVLPILSDTSQATRRLAAACLSDLAHAPHKLVMRLCEEKADICATLLLRSPVLQDSDLVTLIAQNGVTFARVIARRTAMTKNLRGLLLALGDSTVATLVTAETAPASDIHPEIKASKAEISEKLEAARDALRKMMIAQPSNSPEMRQALPAPLPEQLSAALPKREPMLASSKLRATALLLDDGFFITALADIHGLSFERAKRVVQRAAPSEMMTALHAAGVSTADAFIILSAFYPQVGRDKQEIALFLSRYEMMVQDQTAANVRRWKAEDISSALRAKPANYGETAHKQLKAS